MGAVTMPADATSWLAQLAADRAPPPPGWWPPAPGWWVLTIVLLLMMAGLIRWGLRWWRGRHQGPQALRRAALRELDALARTAPNDAALARDLEHLLRRLAVARHGRAAVAGLSGEAWLAFVAAHGGADWAGDAGRALLRTAYGGQAESHRARWLSGARAFIQHRPRRASRAGRFRRRAAATP